MNEQKFLNKKQPQDTINIEKLKRKKRNELQHKIVIFQFQYKPFSFLERHVKALLHVTHKQ